MGDVEALTGEFSRDGWQAFVAPGPSKGTVIPEKAVDFSWDYQKAGLVAEGSVDTYREVENAIAETSDGLQVIVDVTPMSFGGGTQTIFALKPEMSQLIFPKPSR